MADKNGYTSNFKRNPKEKPDSQDGGEDAVILNEKAQEYVRDLINEKNNFDAATCPLTTRLVDSELTKVQTTGRIPHHDTRYLDVLREKPAKVVVKVLVPVKEHPKFNFVGKLLGVKGNTLKALQEETMCKMAVLGRGSMRDKQKEDELRATQDPKFSHLNEELHVEVASLGPPAEAHARIAYALAELRKYLTPDANDNIRQEQLREMMDRSAGPPPGSRLPPPPPRGLIPPPPPAIRGGHRPIPPKAKVMSILDRARNAMEESYVYEDPYAAALAPPRHHEDYYSYERRAPAYYDEEEIPAYSYERRERGSEREYGGSTSSTVGKVSSREVGSRRSGAPRYRASPYDRQHK